MTERAALLREWLAERKTPAVVAPDIEAVREQVAKTTRRSAKVYSVTEAAARLGLDPSEVRRQIRNGRLQAHKTSGGYVTTEAQLLRFERERLPRGRPRKRRPR